MPGECVREAATPTGPLVQMPVWIFLTSGFVKGLTPLDMPASCRGGSTLNTQEGEFGYSLRILDWARTRVL